MNAATFRLREMRERAGMTQAQLGALVGITNAAISKFERGKNPSFSRATDIAIALGCTLDELAGIEGKAPEMTTREQLLADVEGHLSAIMRDPRYWRDRDPELIEAVADAFRRLYPDSRQATHGEADATVR